MKAARDLELLPEVQAPDVHHPPKPSHLQRLEEMALLVVATLATIVGVLAVLLGAF